jgi:ElaB/YqjD/DUF883 family membrane-anchored ribosome-binding protein
MEPNPDESDVPGVVGRRSARLSIIVPVTVRGADAAGQPFKENTWTISVNKHGGRIATFHQLAVNDQIIVENPLLGRTAKARVNRICEKRFAEDPYEVCVELLEAQNIWGVKLPPEDWQKEQQIVSASQKSPTPQAVPPAPKAPAPTTEISGTAEAAPLAPRGPSGELKEPTGGLSQFNMAVNALSRFAGEANVAPPPTPLQRQDAVGGAKAPVGHPPAPDLHSFKALEEKISEAQSLRQELTILADRVQSARAEVENLLLKAREAQREGASEAEQAAKKVEEASGKRLQSALATLDQEVERRLGSAFTRLAEETQKRLQAEAAGIIEKVAKDMDDRLSPLAQESLSKAVFAQCKHAAEQIKAELDELVNDATVGVQGRIQKVMADVSPSLSAQIEQSAEQVSRARLEEFKAQIEQVRRSSEESSQQNLERLRQEIQAEILNATIQTRKMFKEESGTAAKAISVCVDSAVDSMNRAGDEAVSKLEAARRTLEPSSKKAADECLQQLGEESASVLEKFRAEAQALAAQLQSEVKSTARESSEKASGDISERLEGAVEGALELVARDFNKQAEDALDMLKEGLRSARQQCVEETQRQLAAARESTLAALESEAGVSLASFRERLHSTLLEMQAQQTKEMERAIQTSLQSLLESLSNQLRSTADESAARVMAEVRSKVEQALQDLQGRLYKSVGMAALVAKEWEEQAKTHLEAHLSNLLEGFRKQLEALATAAQERARSDAEAFQGLLQNRLQQAARLFEYKNGDAGQSTEMAHEESKDSPFQSPQASQDPLQPDLEPPLVEKQQSAFEEALDDFRSGLDRIFVDHPPKE